MPIFFVKSLLAIPLLVLVLVSLFTMFEVFGRGEKKYNIEKLKKIHRANGIMFILLYLVITYFCIEFLWKAKTETSPRATFHAELALAVILLLGLKISFVRVYRQFYGQARVLGIIIALLSLAMIANSAGHYLLVTKFGLDLPAKKAKEMKRGPLKVTVKTDPESIGKGKELYEAKCTFCHDPYSDKTAVGPGHKGLLKNPTLQASQKPATPENVVEQLLNPYQLMPSFAYLSDEDILSLIAFLNTL
jgi:mono/diheme cytochrome c family protein